MVHCPHPGQCQGHQGQGPQADEEHSVINKTLYVTMYIIDYCYYSVLNYKNIPYILIVLIDGL